MRGLLIAYLEWATHGLRGNGHAVDDALSQYLSPLPQIKLGSQVGSTHWFRRMSKAMSGNSWLTRICLNIGKPLLIQGFYPFSTIEAAYID